MQNGYLDQAPIWNDVATLCQEEVAAHISRSCPHGVGGIIGGIPCQPWSVSGKRRGHEDDRDLWPATFAAIKKYQPEFVFIENVPGIFNQPMGGKRIIEDLEGCGYRTEAGLFSSEEIGASHKRERVFILGINSGDRWSSPSIPEKQWGKNIDNFRPTGCMGYCKQTGSQVRWEKIQGQDHEWPRTYQRSEIKESSVPMGYAKIAGLSQRQGITGNNGEKQPAFKRECSIMAESGYQQIKQRKSAQGWQAGNPIGYNCQGIPRYAPMRNDYQSWASIASVDSSIMPSVESPVRGTSDGMANRVDRIRSIGNGVDPLVAGYAFITLFSCLEF
jgi:DNA (cytosine-5)-methyltransferase 1